MRTLDHSEITEKFTGRVISVEAEKDIFVYALNDSEEHIRVHLRGSTLEGWTLGTQEILKYDEEPWFEMGRLENGALYAEFLLC